MSLSKTGGRFQSAWTLPKLNTVRLSSDVWEANIGGKKEVDDPLVFHC